MSLTFLSEIVFPLVVGLFIIFPLKYIVEEPPPSRLYAVSQPRSLRTLASWRSDRPELAEVLPSETTNT